MKIAVLMSTYNGYHYLNQQLESLANQTVAESMTVYIRDDGSTDDTFDIIEKWKSRLSLILYKGKNAGPAMSFWWLLMNPEIQADYYAFCVQDDVWDSDKLEVAVNQLNGDTHFYACNCRIIDEKGQTIKTERMSQKPEIDLAKLYVTGCTQGCSMVFSDALRKYMEKLDIRCVPMHDVVLMLYAIYFGKIYWDELPHFGYRVHSNNVVVKSNKSAFKRIKTTYWNWKNSKKNSMSEVAAEMLKNISNLPSEDQRFLKYVSEYKKHRIWLIRNAKKSKVDSAAVRSFKIRILMGMY